MKSHLPVVLLALAPLAAHAAGAPSQERRVDRVRWLMGTFCEIRAESPDAQAAVTAAFDEIERWDEVLSLYKKDSELNALNASAGTGPFRASADLYAATEEALRLARETGGAFDPTVLPAIRGGPAALRLVGWRKVRLDPARRTITLPLKGMGLDFGGVGKGRALDRAAALLRARGVTSALLNFGGQILAVGAAPDGRAWSVVLPGRAAPLRLRDASVATSGDAQRPGHIVSPFDGRPLRRRARATAVLSSAAAADAWSTALYVLGRTPASFRGRACFSPGNPAPHGARRQGGRS
jgi:thiamine biosynthesis lipoprotein